MQRLRRALLWLGVSLALPSQAGAWTLQYGQSYIEQGDFLVQPGVQLGLRDNKDRRYRFDFYGRRFGSFTEATAILGFDEALKIFPWPELQATYGVSFMDQYTARDSTLAAKKEIHSLNLGVNLGLDWRILTVDQWTLDAAWNSHLFAAGFAFILLTTARKSIFTLGVGYTL